MVDDPTTDSGATLTVLTGVDAGLIVAIQAEILTLGRAPESDLRFDDLGVSHHHARIGRTADGGFYLEDLASAHGTFLATARVGVAVLHSGDLLQLGPHTRLRFAAIAPAMQDENGVLETRGLRAREACRATIRPAASQLQKRMARRRSSNGPPSVRRTRWILQIAQPMNDRGLEAARVATDAKLAEERARADALLVAAAAAEASAVAIVATERAATDDRLRAERSEVDAAACEAKAAFARRDETLAMVSHDLRTPLAIIAMDAQLIGQHAPDDPGGAPIRSRALEIVAFCARMRVMIGDLTDVVALSSGAMAMRVVRADVRHVIDETLASLTVLPEAAGLSVLAEPSTGPLVVSFDPDRIRRVLVNLVGNAMKFTDAGGSIVVSAARRETEVLVCVRDTGIGIRAEELPRIFDRFRRVGEGDRVGLGLGLYICKTIVEAHGGVLGVASEIGRGSTFFFTLPSP
jgi:signal transduction histidine kinase